MNALKVYSTENLHALDFFVDFINLDSNPKIIKRYIFGHNQYSKSIINSLVSYDIRIDGIIDDFTDNKYYQVAHNYKIPIIKLVDLCSHSCNNIDNIDLLSVKVVVVVTSQTKKAFQKLQALQVNFNFLDFIDYFAIQRVSREFSQKNCKNNTKFKDVTFLELEFFDSFKQSQVQKDVSTWEDFRSDYKENKVRYEKIFEILADMESMSQFEKIINFRLNQDYSFMKNFDYRPSEQYFEDFYNIANIKYFFDIGAYRGETSLEFAKRCESYKKIYYFEPERQNFIIAQNILENNLSNIQGFNIALSDRDGEVFFCSDTTSSHMIDNSNETLRGDDHDVVTLQKLDTLMRNRQILLDDTSLNRGGVFVKIDIESAELSALYGMEEFISTYTPVIAICVYHSFDDLWKIPEMLLSINKQYKIYFRHYSSGLTESVMFFVP